LRLEISSKECSEQFAGRRNQKSQLKEVLVSKKNIKTLNSFKIIISNQTFKNFIWKKIRKNLNFLKKNFLSRILTWEKPKNPNFLKKMDPEKPNNPKTQVLPTLFESCTNSLWILMSNDFSTTVYFCQK